MVLLTHLTSLKSMSITLPKQPKRQTQKGFTIIEVLIVLAIAGFIILVVFLAVPALQRSERNIERKHDVGTLLAALSEYKNNNAFALPALIRYAGAPNAIYLENASGTGNISTFDFVYYHGFPSSAGSPSEITIATYTPAMDGTNISGTEQLNVVTGAICTADGTAMTAGGGQNVAILYTLEVNTKACQYL